MASENMQDFSYVPEECLYRYEKVNNRLSFGIPKEEQRNETRLALTPEAVGILVSRGYKVLVESEAGNGMNYTDMRFADNGATIVNTKEEAFNADIILKIAPPTPEEACLMRNRSSVFSMLQLSLLKSDAVKEMAKKHITAVAYDLLLDSNKNYPIASALHEISGMTAISVASQYMSNENGGKGLLLGGIAGISSTEVLIIGADIAGESAARTAMALGAQVKVFDHDISKLRKIQHQLGQSLFTSVLHPQVLNKAFKSADAVISTLRYIEGGERFFVTEDTVMTMKKGAVIVDLSTDLGGCFETTRCMSISEPAYIKDGVIHYCVPNITSRVSRTSSMAISNVLAPMMLRIASYGGMRHAIDNEYGIMNGVYTNNGHITNHLIARHLGLNTLNKL